MKEIKKAMYEKGNVWKVLYVVYAMIFVLNVIIGIKNKNIVYINVCSWILNSIILFACARMNEKRADKFQKLYFEKVERDFEEKANNFYKEKKNE